MALLTAAQGCDLCWLLTPASLHETASVSSQASLVCVWVCVGVGGVTLWLLGMHLNSDPVLFKGGGLGLCVMVVVDYRNLSVRCLTVVLHWLALCPTPHTKAASWRAVVCNHDNKALRRGQWGNRGLVNIFMIRKTEIKFHVRGCGCCRCFHRHRRWTCLLTRAQLCLWRIRLFWS